MDATDLIRNSVARVMGLRKSAADNPELARALSDIKQFQTRRFIGTYADLLQSTQYQSAALFFLEELYGEKDYALRDAQFARIAGTLERLFPRQVVETAVLLAQLHGLTEELDLAMAQIWTTLPRTNDVARYVAAWRAVGRCSDRHQQLARVLEIGHELVRLTRTPGLRLMLKMMRVPARLAGLSSFQHFIESGFDTFVAMGRKGEGVAYFLETLQARETRLMNQLFDADLVTCETEIHQLLGQSR
ncbi:MAG: hypothetical protein V4713_16130 [Pseudomonadota bacterium]